MYHVSLAPQLYMDVVMKKGDGQKGLTKVFSGDLAIMKE